MAFKKSPKSKKKIPASAMRSGAVAASVPGKKVPPAKGKGMPVSGTPMDKKKKKSGC